MLPSFAAGGEDAGEQGFTGFHGFASDLVGLAPVAGEFAGDGGLEHGLAVTLNQLRHLFQRALAFVDTAEQFVDLGDDAFLLTFWRDGNFVRLQNGLTDVLLRAPPALVP